MPYFLSNRTSLYYESGGQGPTLLLISPPGVGTAIFEQQQELKDRFHVVTFDPRGNGKSQKGNIGDYTMEDWTDDMLALINHLNDKQVILCGYSLGGLPAQMFAIKYPRKTASLILINSFPLVNTFLLNVKFNLGIWSTYEDIRGILGKGLAFSHTKKKNQQRHIRTSVEASDPHVLKWMYKNGKKFDSLSLLSSILCPTGIIYGGRDIFTKPYQRYFKKSLPQSHMIQIKGGGHQLPTKAANEVNGILLQWKTRS